MSAEDIQTITERLDRQDSKIERLLTNERRKTALTAARHRQIVAALAVIAGADRDTAKRLAHVMTDDDGSLTETGDPDDQPGRPEVVALDRLLSGDEAQVATFASTPSPQTGHPAMGGMPDRADADAAELARRMDRQRTDAAEAEAQGWPAPGDPTAPGARIGTPVPADDESDEDRYLRTGQWPEWAGLSDSAHQQFSEAVGRRVRQLKDADENPAWAAEAPGEDEERPAPFEEVDRTGGR